jgi:hypothetical protein
VQQAVAARDAAIAASIASRPAPIKRPVGRLKVLAPLGAQAPPGERHVWAELQLRWSGEEHQVRLHLHFTAKAAAGAAAAEPQKLKKQAVWVRMHLQGRRGRERVVLSLRATPFPLRKKSPNSQSSQISLTFQGPRKSLMLAN